jgi:hypothetical protein
MGRMRITRTRDCGELLQFDDVRRRLHIGMPQFEGIETIAVADIIGTVGRAGDFDGCFRPREAHLAGRIHQIALQHPEGLNEPIEVVRVDHAYFVVDGHKRVSMAKADGREFIDARISGAPSHYQLAPGVAPEAIALTGMEERMREATGLMQAVPSARFVMSEPEGYAELQEVVEAYGYELSHRLGRLLPREEAAALWYECVYRPTIKAAARSGIPKLLRCATESDLFMSLHRQSRELWGRECTVAQDEADHLVAKILDGQQPDGSVIGRLVQRARRRRVPEVLPQRA